MVKEFKPITLVLDMFKDHMGGTIKVGCEVRGPGEHNMKYVIKLCVFVAT